MALFQTAQTSVPFTAFGTDGPDTAAINSMLASFTSQFDQTRTVGIVPATTTANIVPTPPVATSSSFSNSRFSSITGTTLSTLPSRSGLSSSVSSSAVSTAVTTRSETGHSTAPTAPSSAGASQGGVTQQESCNSISCSAGLKAAVAVPVVVGVLGIIALAAFLIRRRKKKAQSQAQGIGKPEKGKKWTRHLRVFSFDAELLMGGRFSSTNSLRSGNTSVRDNVTSPHPRQADQPSIHSIDEVAPPYRDAVNHAQPLNMTQVGPGILAAGALSDPIARPASSATAPPPYVSGSRQSNRPSTGNSSQRNPFTDSIAVSPVEGSPFNDPLEGNSHYSHSVSSVSRNSSLNHGHGADDTSTLNGSEAASIHEARVGRHVSVNSAGRAFNNVRLSQPRSTPSP